MRLQVDFWAEVSQRVPEIHKLSACAASFDKLVVATERNYEGMIKLQPRSAQALLEYSQFEHDVRAAV